MRGRLCAAMYSAPVAAHYRAGVVALIVELGVDRRLAGEHHQRQRLELLPDTPSSPGHAGRT